MLPAKSAGVAHRVSGADARGIDQLGGRVNFLATTKIKPPQVIRAELTGADTCTARGITSRSSTPVLAMCRRLIEAGCEAPKARNQFARWLDEQEAARVKKNDAQAAS